MIARRSTRWRSSAGVRGGCGGWSGSWVGAVCVVGVWVGVVGGGLPVRAASHREAPLISFDDIASSSDVYVFPRPGPEADEIYVTAVRSVGFGVGQTNQQVLYQRYDGHLDSDSAVFPTARTVDDVVADPLGVVFEPQIAGNGSGVAAVTYVRGNNFDPGPPLVLPGSQPYVRTFDANGDPIMAASPIGSFSEDKIALPDVTIRSDSGFDVAAFDTSVFNRNIYDANGDLVQSGAPYLPVTGVHPFLPGIKIVSRGGNDTVAVTHGNCANNQCDVVVHHHDPDANPAVVSTTIATGLGGTERLGIDYFEGMGGQEFGATTRVAYDFDGGTRLANVDGGGVVKEAVIGQGLGVSGNAARRPSIATNRDGTTMVVYQFGVPGQEDNLIRAERFAANGTRIGGIMQVNSLTDGFRGQPAVDDLSDGGFVTTFSYNPLDGTIPIHAIDLRAPMAVNARTVIADDFGTPWSNIAEYGYDVTFDGGAPDANNGVAIVGDPLEADTNNGVLELILDVTGGTVRADFDDDLALGGFPNGRRVGDDVVRIELLAVTGSLFRVFDALSLEIEAHDRDNPAAGIEPFPVDVPLLTTPDPVAGDNVVADGLLTDQWTEFELTVPLDAEFIAVLDGISNLALSYSLVAQSSGAAGLYLDDLRVDFVPVPEPGSVFLAVGLGVLVHGRRGRGWGGRV